MSVLKINHLSASDKYEGLNDYSDSLAKAMIEEQEEEAKAINEKEKKDI